MKADLRVDSGKKLLSELEQNQRRLAFLKRSRLFTASMQGAELSRAIDAAELRRAYQIVHDTFVEVGFIKPSPFGTRIRAFEASGESATFVAKKDNEIVGVLGLVVDTPDLGLPSDSCFKKELDELRGRGIKLSEGTNQAVVPSFRKTGITTELIRCGVGHSVVRGCDAIMVTISPSHAHFYEMMGFKRASEVRSYSATIYDPVVMMCVNNRPILADPETDPCLAYTQKYLFTENPYLKVLGAWQEAAEREFRNPELLQGLFVGSSDVLTTCTPRERQAIRLRWGADLFDELVGERAATEPADTGSYVSMRTSPVTAEATASSALL